MHQEPKKCT